MAQFPETESEIAAPAALVADGLQNAGPRPGRRL